MLLTIVLIVTWFWYWNLGVILSLILVLLLGVVLVIVILLVVCIVWCLVHGLRNLLRWSEVFVTWREESWLFSSSLSCSNDRLGWKSTVIKVSTSCLFLFLDLAFLNHWIVWVVTAAAECCWVDPWCKLSDAQFRRAAISVGLDWLLFGLSSFGWGFEIVFITIREESCFLSWSCFCCCDYWLLGECGVVKVPVVLNWLILPVHRGSHSGFRLQTFFYERIIWIIHWVSSSQSHRIDLRCKLCDAHSRRTSVTGCSGSFLFFSHVCRLTKHDRLLFFSYNCWWTKNYRNCFFRLRFVWFQHWFSRNILVHYWLGFLLEIITRIIWTPSEDTLLGNWLGSNRAWFVVIRINEFILNGRLQGLSRNSFGWYFLEAKLFLRTIIAVQEVFLCSCLRLGSGLCLGFSSWFKVISWIWFLKFILDGWF